MRIHLLTIHPPMCTGPLEESILGKAREKGLLDARVVNIRDFATGKHQITDDYPYGGGAGLVMKPEPIFDAVEWCLANAREGNGRKARIILMCPQGELFTQEKAWELAQEAHLIFVCGRYEGVDERVRTLVTDELSIGDYVLTGGELPALVIIDAVARLIPGVVGDQASVWQDSFSNGLLEGPQYTRPPEYRGLRVPEILLSGDHAKIRRWRRKESVRRTYLRRPDLLGNLRQTPEDASLLEEVKSEEKKGPGSGE